MSQKRGLQSEGHQRGRRCWPSSRASRGVPVADLPLPEGTAVALIIRGNALVPPVPGTALQPGDHVHVIARRGYRPFIQLMFGRPEEE
jgi:Trk K+ transport system NAD-binding subunit